MEKNKEAKLIRSYDKDSKKEFFYIVSGENLDIGTITLDNITSDKFVNAFKIISDVVNYEQVMKSLPPKKTIDIKPVEPSELIKQKPFWKRYGLFILILTILILLMAYGHREEIVSWLEGVI